LLVDFTQLWLTKMNKTLFCALVWATACAWLPPRQRPVRALHSSSIAKSSVGTSAWCSNQRSLIGDSSTRLNGYSTYTDDNDDTDGEFEDELEEGELTDEELEATMGEWDDRVPRFNTVHLTGRIGGDPETRYFDDGKVVVNVSLATKCKYHGLERKALQIRSGEEETDWYGLEIWVRHQSFQAHSNGPTIVSLGSES
jgi:Single-strand binding protein family